MHWEIRPKFPKMSQDSAKGVVRPNLTGERSATGGVGFQVTVFIIAFVMVYSRRHDAVLNAQFFAEDGKFWYTDAYNLGLHSLLMPQSGYLHTLTRLIALLTLFFRFSSAPLVMNLSAITVQILPVNVFLSSRFSNIALPTRLLASLIYLALPNTYEVDANITTIQWHLALLACLLLLARPASAWGWRVFEWTVLVLISVDGPMGIVLVPVAWVLWWKRRDRWQLTSLVLLVPGAVIQALSVLLTWHTRQTGPNGAAFSRFASILGRQVFLSSLLGLKTQSWLIRLNTVHLVEAIATAAGLLLLLYVLRCGPMELKLFILFAFAVFALSLARPLAGAPDREQWALLCLPGCGNRYYFLPMLAFLASLFWIARPTAARQWLRYSVLALLLLLPIGIYRDWHYPRFADLHFRKYAGQFEQAPPGTKVTIPINPNWSMELTKH